MARPSAGGRVQVHVGQGDVHVHASPGLAEDAGQGSFNWHGSGAQGPASCACGAVVAERV